MAILEYLLEAVKLLSLFPFSVSTEKMAATRPRGQQQRKRLKTEQVIHVLGGSISSVSLFIYGRNTIQFHTVTILRGLGVDSQC